jgi:hypothetical protein
VDPEMQEVMSRRLPISSIMMSLRKLNSLILHGYRAMAVPVWRENCIQPRAVR